MCFRLFFSQRKGGLLSLVGGVWELRAPYVSLSLSSDGAPLARLPGDPMGKQGPGVTLSLQLKLRLGSLRVLGHRGLPRPDHTEEAGL